MITQFFKEVVQCCINVRPLLMILKREEFFGFQPGKRREVALPIIGLVQICQILEEQRSLSVIILHAEVQDRIIHRHNGRGMGIRIDVHARIEEKRINFLIRLLRKMGPVIWVSL